MSFYFSSDGSLKFTTNQVAQKGISVDSKKTTGNSSSSSSFSQQMKDAALSSAGKMTTDMKKAALANNPDYQRIAYYQQKINAIASKKPRTFSDDDAYVMNASALTGLSTAKEKLVNYKKGSVPKTR